MTDLGETLADGSGTISARMMAATSLPHATGTDAMVAPHSYLMISKGLGWAS
jgi:hypothetical protein